MRKLFISIFTIISLLLCSVVYAIDVPKPQPNTWVHDYANVISENTENSINALGDTLDENGYAQLVIVVVDFLDGYDVEDYAYTLFNEWGIGHSDDNDGVLVLVSVGDREYHMLQGSGLEKILRSSDLGQIADDELIPELVNNDYDNGLLLASSAISDHLLSYYNNGNAGESGETTDTGNIIHKVINPIPLFVSFIFEIIVFLVIMFALFSFINSFGRRRRYYGPRRYYRPYIPHHHHRDYHDYNRPRTSSFNRPSRSFGGGSSSRSSSRSSRSFGGGGSRGGGRGGKF